MGGQIKRELLLLLKSSKGLMFTTIFVVFFSTSPMISASFIIPLIFNVFTKCEEASLSIRVYVNRYITIFLVLLLLMFCSIIIKDILIVPEMNYEYYLLTLLYGNVVIIATMLSIRLVGLVRARTYISLFYLVIFISSYLFNR